MKKRGIFPRIALVIAACVSLLAGVLIYAFFRDAGLPAFRLAGKIFLWERLYRGRIKGGPLFTVLVYNVPDGLWLLSGILCIRALWPEQNAAARGYLFSFCFLALLLELLQCPGVLPGTFDYSDLIALILTAFAESVFYTHFIQRRINHAE